MGINAMAEMDEDIINTVYKYIDRMNDICEQDTAEQVLADFLAEMNPIIDAHSTILHELTGYMKRRGSSKPPSGRRTGW